LAASNLTSLGSSGLSKTTPDISLLADDLMAAQEGSIPHASLELRLYKALAVLHARSNEP